MGRVIRPRPAAWQPREEQLCAQNALWIEQERLYTELALEEDPGRQQDILATLDGTYQEVAEHNWQADWERRSYAIPDAPFQTPEIPERLRFNRLPCPITESAPESETIGLEDQVELELELH